MKQARVLIVDDAIVVRKTLEQMLGEDPRIVVVGSTSGGEEALEAIREKAVDVVTLDMEMPGIDGYETLVKVKEIAPKIKVIICSAHPESSGRSIAELLRAGACDFVSKPSSTGELATKKEDFKKDLVEKVLSSLEPDTDGQARGAASLRSSDKRLLRKPYEIVALGISTGGPDALVKMLPALSQCLTVPLLIVQHMPPMFTKILAERIRMATGIPAYEGEEGLEVKPGCIYIAPGDFHMEIKAGEGLSPIISLNKGPPENSCRPAADVLFRSVLHMYQNKALCVVMTGMGHDGLEGAKLFRKAGSEVLVQDRESSVVWGMPGAIVQAGVATGVFSLESLGFEIAQRIPKKV